METENIDKEQAHKLNKELEELLFNKKYKLNEVLINEEEKREFKAELISFIMNHTAKQIRKAFEMVHYGEEKPSVFKAFSNWFN